MTKLTYRGVAHDGVTTPFRGGRDLLYRGARHDGAGARAPAPAAARVMCYRGVAHTPAPAARAGTGGAA